MKIIKHNPYITERGFEVGVVSVKDSAQHVVGFQLRADAQGRLEHACMCVAILAVKAIHVSHSFQLQEVPTKIERRTSIIGQPFKGCSLKKSKYLPALDRR